MVLKAKDGWCSFFCAWEKNGCPPANVLKPLLLLLSVKMKYRKMFFLKNAQMDDYPSVNDTIRK